MDSNQQALLTQSQEVSFQRRSVAIQEKLAERNLDKLDAWWRRIKIQHPHKYLLPVILAQLCLTERYNTKRIWQFLLKLNQEESDLYHFRSVFDVRIFLMYRKLMPQELRDDYCSMDLQLRLLFTRSINSQIIRKIQKA